jgi:SAM-dependent methyltransferase
MGHEQGQADEAGHGGTGHGAQGQQGQPGQAWERGHGPGQGEVRYEDAHHGHAHGPGHGAEVDQENRYTQEFWDERYSSAERLWSGLPNAQLVAQASDLIPGLALDAGCGEGADAIWLAARGWRVTGVDVSAVALERAAQHAADQGADVAGRLTWERRDLLDWGPEPDAFDLVTSAFMHPAGDALRVFQQRLAAGVRPGGTLLIVTHHVDDVQANVGRPNEPSLFASAADMVAGFDQAHWKVVVASAFARPATDLDGQPTTVKDTVVRLQRESDRK